MLAVTKLPREASLPPFQAIPTLPLPPEPEPLPWVGEAAALDVVVGAALLVVVSTAAGAWDVVVGAAALEVEVGSALELVALLACARLMLDEGRGLQRAVELRLVRFATES